MTTTLTKRLGKLEAAITPVTLTAEERVRRIIAILEAAATDGIGDKRKVAAWLDAFYKDAGDARRDAI